jgi:hypothetical protein
MLKSKKEIMYEIEGLDEDTWIKIHSHACKIKQISKLSFSDCLIESFQQLPTQTSDQGVSDDLANPN